MPCDVTACVLRSGQSVDGRVDDVRSTGHGAIHRADVGADRSQSGRHRRQRDGHHGRLHAQQAAQHDHQQVHRLAGRRRPHGRSRRPSVLQRQRGTVMPMTLALETGARNRRQKTGVGFWRVCHTIWCGIFLAPDSGVG